MNNYTIAEFLGIFLIGIPVFYFATIVWVVGLHWLLKTLGKGEGQNVFHHHFHYKDTTKERYLRKANKKDEWL